MDANYSQGQIQGSFTAGMGAQIVVLEHAQKDFSDL